MGEGEKGIKRIVGNKIATLFGLSSIFDDPHRLLKEIGLSSSKVYKRVPYQCYICGHKRFSNLSLLGVYKKPVFYECEECGALHLKYEEDWIADKVKGLKGTYINPQDWDEEPPRSEYN